MLATATERLISFGEAGTGRDLVLLVRAYLAAAGGDPSSLDSLERQRVRRRPGLPFEVTAIDRHLPDGGQAVAPRSWILDAPDTTGRLRLPADVAGARYSTSSPRPGSAPRSTGLTTPASATWGATLWR